MGEIDKSKLMLSVLKNLRVLLIALAHSRIEKGSEGKMMSSVLEPFTALSGL